MKESGDPDTNRGGNRLKALCAVVGLLSLAGCSGGTTASDPLALCQQLLTEQTVNTAHGLSTERLLLTNWNIEKGNNSGWQSDLDSLSTDADLLLLQEAIPERYLQPAVDGNWHFSFAEGYRAGELNTGVMTASVVEPLAECHLTHNEPWLRTPKATNITKYPLQNAEQTLLVVNVHLVNFAFGIKDFEQQLTHITKVIEQHEGPVILSGDFNTWRKARTERLHELVSRLDMQAIDFDQDHRKQFFGYHLDHVFVRGLQPQGASTQRVSTSDHNPMQVWLIHQPAASSVVAQESSVSQLIHIDPTSAGNEPGEL